MYVLFPSIATALALFALFGLSEVALRRGLSAEATRGAVHMLGAGTAALFPFYLTLIDAVSLAMTFTAVLTYTWIRRSLQSVHGVTRPTAGALLFPLGLLLAAFACWNRPAVFSFAALVLALADPSAAFVGRRLSSPAWTIFLSHS